MHEANPATSDDQIDHALIDLMQATDAFVSSWANAVRRFAAEPAALTRFRELQRTSLLSLNDRDAAPTAAMTTHPHPLWDRYLDG